MENTIKILTLYKDLTFSAQNNFEQLFCANIKINQVSSNTECAVCLNNKRFLSGTTEGIIKSGKYFFLQFYINEESKNFSGLLTENSWDKIRQQTEELYLESLWQNIPFNSDLLYVRKLEEGSKPVFQLLIEIL